jgi:pimeloyl-ACP methyl ester carboxylesterase
LQQGETMRRIITMVMLFRNVAAVAVMFSCISNAYAIEESLQKVSSRDADQKFLLSEPDGKPIASVILFAGGYGGLKLSSSFGKPSIGKRKSNFLVRTRKQFAEHGFLVATVDAPEDSPKMNPRWRMGDKHAADITNVIAFLKQQADVPVWAVGTSMGTFSAANMGIRLKDTIHGVVLTSSVTDIPSKYDLYKDYPRGTINMELNKVTGPVFIASHEHDKCPRTPPKSISDLAGQFTSSRNVEKVVFSGPNVQISKPCNADSPHGFLKIESKIVDAIAKFIVNN